MKLCPAVFVVFVFCTSTGSASSRAQRDRGAAVFSASGCAHCHSIRGSGGHKGPDLSGIGRRMKTSSMRTQIVDGGKLMPPFGEDLQSAEIKDLLAYLHSCKAKK
ncbi:MAG: cytochrome c [Terracidiphilus sp.]|jgi:ubiquinol-cytochrome c reductase cytochrome b subunit